MRRLRCPCTPAIAGGVILLCAAQTWAEENRLTETEAAGVEVSEEEAVAEAEEVEAAETEAREPETAAGETAAGGAPARDRGEAGASAADDPADGSASRPADDAHHDDDGATHDPERIVVTGAPIEHDRDELALTVDRIDREEILERAGATVGETLVYRPGIATTGFTGGASRPVIRGQDAFRTEVLEDGLPTQDVSRESPDHAVPTSPLSARRIEVVRGPGTLRYGGGATGGVVNSITNRVPDSLLDERIRGELYGAVDTVADRREFGADLDGSLGDFSWHLDGFVRDSEDYRIPDGTRQNGTFADGFGASGGGSYFFGDKARIGASYSRFEAEYGIPEEDEEAFIDLRTNRVRFEGDVFDPFRGVRELRVRGVWSGYEHDEIAVEMGVPEIGQTYINSQFDGRLELLHDPLLGFVGAAGLTGRTRGFEAGGEAEEFLAPTDTTQVAFYLFEERPFHPTLVGEFGMRIEGSILEGTPFGATERTSRGFVPVSGSGGLVFTPTEELSFGLVGAISQRAPDVVELFARGPHEATGTFEIGDADAVLGIGSMQPLGIETSYKTTLRATYQRERLRAEIAGFFTFYQDYIFANLTGNLVDEMGMPGGDLEELFYQSRDALFGGVALAGQAAVLDAQWGTFSLDGRFDWVRAAFTAGGNVPRIPPIRWGGGGSYRCDFLRIRVGFSRSERQGDIALTGETATPAYTFLETLLQIRLSPLDGRIPVTLNVAGQNLTNEVARNHVSFNADELVLPGQNVRVWVTANF